MKKTVITGKQYKLQNKTNKGLYLAPLKQKKMNYAKHMVNRNANTYKTSKQIKAHATEANNNEEYKKKNTTF